MRERSGKDLSHIAAAAAERHTGGDDRHAQRIHAEQTTGAARGHATPARPQAHVRGKRDAPSIHFRGEARTVNPKIIGSRGSDLALWQSRTVLAALRDA